MSNNNSRTKNALTHGYYASDVVLAWENQHDFDDLLQAYRDEYCPDGVSEEEAVFDLASLHWKKRRLNIGSQLAFHKQREAGAMATASSQGWKGVADYLARGDGDRMADAAYVGAKSQSEAVKQVCDMIRKRIERICKTDEAAEKKEDSVAELEKLVTLAKELNLVGQSLVPLLRAIEEHNFDQRAAAHAYRPDIMEKELKLHAEIDRRIEKVMRRLVQAKEYKKLYGAKSIDIKQNGVTSLPAKSPIYPHLR
jgi:hypothetical protein